LYAATHAEPVKIADIVYRYRFNAVIMHGKLPSGETG